MKITNLKINKKAITKLATCVLVGSLAATALTGCGDTVERDNILKGTILENTRVVTFNDGFKDIVVAIGHCSKSQYSHYYSITSGNYIVDEQCSHGGDNPPQHYGIDKEENITNYLNADELEKAVQGKLDNNDITNIVVRIINPITEEPKTKTK